MILNEKSILRYFERNTDYFMDAMKSKAPDDDDDDWEEMEALFDTPNKIKYVFAKSVLNTLDTIRIKDDFDCNILHSRKTINGVFILSEKEIYIVHSTQEKIRVLYLNIIVEEDATDVQLFTFNLVKNEKVLDPTIDNNTWKKFLQCLIYLDFLPTDVKYIKPGMKHGTKKGDQFLNRTNDNVILITKNWNTDYKTEPGTSFLSRSHWGIRWTGKGRSIPKLVYVQSSLKELNKPAQKKHRD